jgi:hypothetical protein
MAGKDQEPQIRTIVETENYSIWRADEPDGETTYNLQLNNVTINFFQEEWDEFLALVRELIKESKK